MTDWRGNIELLRTCTACPEQYDAYIGDKKIGYLRLRHGHFTVRLYDAEGPLVYTSATVGNGAFDESEYDYQIQRAKDALRVALQGNTDGFLRGMRVAAEIVDQYIKTRVINQAVIPDLEAVRDGFSMGASAAEIEGEVGQ